MSVQPSDIDGDYDSVEFRAKSHSIVLHNESEVLPTTLLLRCFEDISGSIEIERIEMYADPERKVCIADDIALTSLPGSTQMMVNAALDTYLHNQREQANRDRLLARMLPDASYVRVWDDFFSRISGERS